MIRYTRKPSIHFSGKCAIPQTWKCPCVATCNPVAVVIELSVDSPIFVSYFQVLFLMATFQQVLDSGLST
jgi:hypothetical protein